MNKAGLEKIESLYDSIQFSQYSNMAGVIKRLLWSVVCEEEGKGLKVGDIDNLVRIVMDSSRYAGPEGEEYTAFDHTQADPIIKRLQKVLEKKGITPSTF